MLNLNEGEPALDCLIYFCCVVRCSRSVLAEFYKVLVVCRGRCGACAEQGWSLVGSERQALISRVCAAFRCYSLGQAC